MNIAIISLGGKSSLDILEECKNYFDEADHLDIRKIEVSTKKKQMEVLYDGKPMKDYDCIYIRGSHKYSFLQRAITEALQENTYMPLKADSFSLAHNKFLTLMELQKRKIPVPNTYLAATVKKAKEIIERVDYPIIMKIPEGTQGKGVMFADSVESAKSILDALDVFRQPYIIQEYIETNATDLRAIVIGNKVVASMRRKALGRERRANIHAGGIGQPTNLDYEATEMAIKAAEAVKGEIVAVDLLEGNKTSVLEVNLSPGLQGVTEATKIKVAKKIASYLHEKTEEFKKHKKSKEYGTMMNDLGIEEQKEIFTNLNMKAGIIKIPSLIGKRTGLKEDDEVIITADKGKVTIKRHKIG